MDNQPKIEHIDLPFIEIKFRPEIDSTSFSGFAVYKSVLAKNYSSWVSKLFGTPGLANTVKDLVTGKPTIISLCV